MNFLDKKLKDAEVAKIKIDREIDFLKKYLSEDCEFLNDLKTYITDHDKYFSINIEVKDLNDLKLIVHRFKPSETIKNNLKSTSGETENLSPFLIKCGYFKGYNTTHTTISVSYIVDENLKVTINVPFMLLNPVLTHKEAPYKPEEYQVEIALNKSAYYLAHSVFATSLSYVNYNYYYADNELGIRGMNNLLGLN